MKLTRADIEALMEKDNGMENLAEQLEAWGIDDEDFSDIMAAWAAHASERMAGLPLEVSLGVAWGGAFLIGYAARIEVETREMQAREDADLIGHAQDAADALDRIDVRDLRGPRERCQRTEAMARCVYNAGHAGDCLWEDAEPPEERKLCLRTDGASAPLPCCYTEGHSGPCYFRH